MEKSSAARAMGWSIDLEKGLRSKRPGHPIESIHKMGPRLNQWSMDPQLTIPVYNMLGLVPGEDRLFGDAILLRLASAFVTGDNVTRIAIIKVFMSTRRHSKTKDAQGHGIFSNLSLEISLELLRRVKVLLSGECIESRSLVFVLLGCWAEIIKDIAEIRHAILSTLVSSHVMEVTAALFAAGCFAEVSDDFASIFLERLLNLVTSPKTSPAVKIAGARALSKVNYSVLLTIKSYKAGAELVRTISEEDILATMLMSLTKLSCKAVILISEQVDLLSSFLAQETSLHMQASLLRCLLCLAERAICFVPISSSLIHCFLKIFDDPNMPSPLRCDVLRIFLKIIAYELHDMQLAEINGFPKLLRYVKDTTQSSFFSERLLAFKVLVCISNKMKGRADLTSDRNDSGLLSEVVLAVCDQITWLISPQSDGTVSSKIKQELRSMFKFLLVLVENHSGLGCIIMDKLHSIITSLVNSHNISTSTIQSSPAHKSVTRCGEKGNFPMRKFMFQIHRFLVSYLDILDDTKAATDQVGIKLKDLITFVCGSSLFDCSIHTFYGLLLHYNSGSPYPKDKDTSNSLGSIEIHVCECARNMVGGDNWYAYKAGKFSACEGVWNVANSIFQHLETRVQSQFCGEWLKFLVQFSQLEKNSRMLSQQACHSWPRDNFDHVGVILSGYAEKFREIGDGLSSSDKILEAISVQTQVLCFQRWFLAVRVKVLLVLADILKCFDKIRQPDGNDVSHGDPRLQAIKSMNEISSTLTRLAEEYDLITSSFIDMDPKSMKVISSLALSCSLLSFCIEFTNLAVDSHFLNATEKTGDSWCIIVRDLAKRLWYTESDTRENLMSLLECRVSEDTLNLQPIVEPLKRGCISDDILAVCNYSVQEIISLWKEFLNIRNKDTIPQVSNNSILLLQNVVASLMRVPFRIPEYFFRVRPTIGSVLICSSARNRKHMPIATLGSHLSLNLCIQLKNMPENSFSFSKIYCILYCETKTSFPTNKALPPRGEFQTGYQASKIKMAINLSKRLHCYVVKNTRESRNCQDLPKHDDVEMEAYVCFKTKGRAEGSATCFLDVSAFPVGSYRIQWQCGFVDGCGTFQNLLALNPGPVFSVVRDSLSHK